MSCDVDPDNFFQTSDSIAERKRKSIKAGNNNGNPIRLPSKLLALVKDPESLERVYVSESSGNVRRVDLKTRSINHVYTGASSPLPCIVLSTPKPHTIYAGSWGRHIYSWSTLSRRPGIIIRDAHADFVKSLIHFCLPIRSGPSSDFLPLLISGGADKVINVWNCSTGDRLLLLRGHSMSVLSLAIDPETLPPSCSSESQSEIEGNSNGGMFALWSASSDREIKRWELTTLWSNNWKTVTVANLNKNVNTFIPLPTTVNQILFTPLYRSEDGKELVKTTDLLACSASGGVAVLSRYKNWDSRMILEHGEQNGIRVMSSSENGSLLVCAGRDEDIWLWDLDEGEKVGKWYGHADEISGLVWVDLGPGKAMVVSGSLDGTIRTWEVNTSGKGFGMGWVESAEDLPRKPISEGKNTTLSDADEVLGEQIDDIQLTAEEEAEIADLMGDD